MKGSIEMRAFPLYDVKGGDVVSGREVFDVVDTFGPGGRVAVKFVDGTRELFASWDVVVSVEN